MTGLRPLAILALAFACGMAGAVGFGLFARQTGPVSIVPQPRPSVTLRPLADGVWVAAQIEPDDIEAIGHSGFKTVVDLRPDEEVAAPLTSHAIGARVRGRGMDFRYRPVPQGEVSEAAVTEVAALLSRRQGPILLYCRSGSRAARIWALAEAGLSGGLPVEAIDARVIAAGESLDGIAGQVDARAARRIASR